MAHWTKGFRKSSLLAVSALFCGLLLSGCEDHITVFRDPDISVPKGSTWAWRPIAPPRDSDKCPVVSRDVISRRESVVREPGANQEIVRQRIRAAIEQTLSSKGLKQVGDPQGAEHVHPGE